MAAREAAARPIVEAGPDVDDEFPCADFALLVPLKRSPEYRAIRPRVADAKPVDAWQCDGVHYFLFALRPEDAGPAASAASALFVMRAEEPGPVSALVVTPDPAGGRARVADLRRPGASFVVHL